MAQTSHACANVPALRPHHRGAHPVLVGGFLAFTDRQPADRGMILAVLKTVLGVVPQQASDTLQPASAPGGRHDEREEDCMTAALGISKASTDAHVMGREAAMSPPSSRRMATASTSTLPGRCFLRKRGRRIILRSARRTREAVPHCRSIGMRFGVGLSPFEIYRAFDADAQPRSRKLAALDALARRSGDPVRRHARRSAEARGNPGRL